MKYRGFRDLKAYQLAYKLAMEIFEETKKFPKEERYSLIDQIRRSSRSIVANIAEAWKKRIYVNSFVSKLTDSYAEEGETEAWLDIAFDCGYLTKEKHQHLRQRYDEVSAMLYSMITHPDKFCT